MVDYLNGLDDADFGDWRGGRGISQHKLAAILSDYEIYPTAFSVDGRTSRGYSRVAFEDATERYLRPAPQLQSARVQSDQCLQGGGAVLQSAIGENHRTSENAGAAKQALQSCTLAVPEPPNALTELQEVRL